MSTRNKNKKSKEKSDEDSEGSYFEIDVPASIKTLKNKRPIKKAGSKINSKKSSKKNKLIESDVFNTDTDKKSISKKNNTTKKKKLKKISSDPDSDDVFNSDSDDDYKPEKSDKDSDVSDTESTSTTTSNVAIPDTDRAIKLIKLNNFLGKYEHTDETSETVTHMSFESNGDQTDYSIPKQEMKKFMDLYAGAILEGNKICIKEKHTKNMLKNDAKNNTPNVSPLLIRLKFVYTEKKRIFKNQDITRAVKAYVEIIKKYLDVKADDLTAYVLYKDHSDMIGGEYVDNVYIIFPHLILRKSIQIYFRSKFIAFVSNDNNKSKNAKDNHTYANFAEDNDPKCRIRHINTIDDLVDINCINRDSMYLYGSCIGDENSKYEVKLIYQYYLNDDNEFTSDIVKATFDNSSDEQITEYIKLFSIRRGSAATETKLLSKINLKKYEKSAQDVIDKLKSKYKDGDENEDFSEIVGSDCNFTASCSAEMYEEAKILVGMIGKKKAADYTTWYIIGRCLFNISYDLLPVWKEFTKNCKDKDRIFQCDRLWGKFHIIYSTLATLHKYAEEDNPKKYKKYLYKQEKDLINEASNGDHHNMAKLFLHKFRYKFKCGSIKHNDWFQYVRHKWVRLDEAHAIRLLLSEEIAPIFQDKVNELRAQARNERGKIQKNTNSSADWIADLSRKLGEHGFKNNIVKSCADLFYDSDPDFLNRLDENSKLMVFDNGVYDFDLQCFRAGCPDDSMSLSTKYNYIIPRKGHAITKDIQNFLQKIQPVKKIRDYLLKVSSKALSGFTGEESFYVLTGTGANGKSKYMELLKHVFGEYFKPMDIRILTEKRGTASSASPEIADKKGIRMCPFDEPNSNDEINAAFMKIFTGGDMIPARELYKSIFYFKPQFTPFLLCNDLPKIADDDGTWRRIKVIDFKSKFLKRGGKEEPNEKLFRYWADNKLSEKLKLWRQYFAYMLIQIHNDPADLIHPREVMTATDEYRKKCDVICDFISDKFIEVENEEEAEKEQIKISELYKDFKDWHTINYGGRCHPLKELKTYVEKRIRKYNRQNDALYGFRYKEIKSIDKLKSGKNYTMDSESESSSESESFTNKKSKSTTSSEKKSQTKLNSKSKSKK
jgi:P4 family phage/plasmid primase-like protien